MNKEEYKQKLTKSGLFSPEEIAKNADFAWKIIENGMTAADLTKIIEQTEKPVLVRMRVHDGLIELKAHVEALQGSLRRKEDWLELRRLTVRGKRIATRVGDNEMRKYFGVLFNTASTYLGLPGDKDQREESYALT